MISKRVKNYCVMKTKDLYGPRPCGREGMVFDRARKGWLCRQHLKDRLCEFCHANRTWGEVWFQNAGIASKACLCLSCAGWTTRNPREATCDKDE